MKTSSVRSSLNHRSIWEDKYRTDMKYDNTILWLIWCNIAKTLNIIVSTDDWRIYIERTIMPNVN